MDILLANPRGFCAGVDRAIHIVESALEKYGAPVYVRHEIVHNKAVVRSLKEMGAVFIKEVSEVPDGATVIFSAHGVGKNVYKEAEKKSLFILDAACPLVKKVHLSAQKHDKLGTKVVLIGHKGHPEVEGHLGQTDSEMYLVGSAVDVENLPISKDEEVAYITQTTLSIDEAKTVIDALKNKFPNIKGPKSGDLCYATTNRQAAVAELARESDLLLIVGSSNSSNSNRLRELGEFIGIKSYLIDGPEDIDSKWFENCNLVGISSGASAPEHLVKAVVEYLKNNFSINSVKEITTMEENIKFSIPKELEDK
jgi:4-hydroxy-3-methylbut-2-enyl diphosphate reductase